MATKTSQTYKKDYTKPELREKLKEQIKQADKGGEAGKWSARKSQLLKKAYEDQGGGYKHKDHLTKAQKDLHEWSGDSKPAKSKSTVGKSKTSKSTKKS